MKIDKERLMLIRNILINKLKQDFPKEIEQKGSYPKIVLDIISSDNPDLDRLLTIIVKWENNVNSSDDGKALGIKINDLFNLIKKNTLILR